MSIATNILEEELINLKRQVERSEKELEILPRGSISYKEIHGIKYPVIQFEEDGKVKSTKIEKGEKIEDYQFKLERRKIVMNKIKNLKLEINDINRALESLKN